MPFRIPSVLKKNAILIATIVYWFLLLYIVTETVYWFIALRQQNQLITTYRKMELQASDPYYRTKLEAIADEEKRKAFQYAGEGVAFLLFILVGAVFVYRAVRREFILTQQQQNFMMAITHELKTPIAITKLNLETMQKHRLEEQQQRKMIQKTLQETERLNTLANNILISSQLEGGKYKISREQLDISDITAGCLHDFQRRFPERPWHIQLPDNIYISGDAMLMQIMVNNLIENAIKYSPPRSPITLQLVKQNRLILLSVIDEGLGIPDTEKSKIFNRFYRVGNEEIRKTKGTGLGLYLCRKIAADHNADIKVTNNYPAGSIFTIQFKT
jgi:K+-sensing histidine kinase KdpD